MIMILKKSKKILHHIYIYIFLITAIFLSFDQPYTFFYYAYKSKVYFLRKAMMMIIRSLVKIITTHTCTHWYKNIFVQTLVCRDFRNTSRLIYPGDYFKFAPHHVYHLTHTYWNTLIWPHTMIRKYNLHKHTHTHKKMSYIQS